MAALAIACGSESPIVDGGGSTACDGLDTSACLFPFPSDYFRDGATGRLRFGAESLPIDVGGRRVSARAFDGRDGFSVVTPIYFRLEGAILDGAPAVSDIARSLDADSKTAILDADTGRRVAHWAELDHFSVDAGAPIVALRLAEALEYGRRYIVAVQGLIDEEGQPLEAEPGFRAVRDHGGTAPAGVGGRLEHYEHDVFPVLERAGLARSQLILAFDFTTASEADTTSVLLAARDRLFALIGEDGPEYSITSVDELGDGPIGRIVHGVLEVPSFLEPAPTHGPRRLRRDDAGNPVASGFQAVPFDLQIPREALTSTRPFALIQYGHGLLGRRREANNPWARDFAARHDALLLAIDMTGMSDADTSVWLETLTGDPASLPHLAEPIYQGILNHVALSRTFRRRFAREMDPRLSRGGAPLYDPARVYYYGNSQGGTMGGVIMALEADVERGVLGVPGGAFSFLLTRSSQFDEYAALIRSMFPAPEDFLTLMGLVQAAFDAVDPMNYVQHLNDEHRVLLQVAKEDAQVNNQVSHLLARRVGAALLTPALRPVFGLEERPSPFAGTALVEYDFGRPDNPRPNYPAPTESDPHGEVRRLEVAEEQLMRFLTTGEAVNLCDGACDPR